MMSEVAVLIATYGRTDDLGDVLRGLEKQSKLPSLVLIVDSSLNEDARVNRDLVLKYQGVINTQYLRGTRPSLTAQKNEGIQHLRELNMDYVQILDDDTVPDEFCLQKASEFLDKNPDYVGISGITDFEHAKLSRRATIKKGLFVALGLESFQPGTLSFAGCPVPYKGSSGVHDSAWLFGCSMWKMEVFEKIEYESRLVGSALFEDAIFSILANRLGKLAVDTELFLNHKLAKMHRPNLPLHSYRFARNRFFVIKALDDQVVLRTFVFVVGNLALAIWGLVTSSGALLQGKYNLAKMRLISSWCFIKGTFDALADISPR